MSSAAVVVDARQGVLYARNKLQMVDEKVGQDGVKESKLAVVSSEDKKAE